LITLLRAALQAPLPGAVLALGWVHDMLVLAVLPFCCIDRHMQCMCRPCFDDAACSLAAAVSLLCLIFAACSLEIVTHTCCPAVSPGLGWLLHAGSTIFSDCRGSRHSGHHGTSAALWEGFVTRRAARAYGIMHLACGWVFACHVQCECLCFG
jgi:hypothetical protein